MNKRFVIITSINRPSEAVHQFAAWPGWTTIVVGDRKSPPDWACDGVVYLSLPDQLDLAPAFARHIPENTYVRKMIGYLYAFHHGAEAIFESDDDNIPYADSSQVIDADLARRGIMEPTLASECGWINIYSAFGARNCWPRGFPLHQLAAARESSKQIDDALPWGVLQYLADEDPDVDAIYRMTGSEAPVYFARARQLSLARHSYSPFNSQATLWVPETFPLMFLPLGVKDRVTDILRGYMALACLWANGMTLGCASPVVYQERNAHNLLNDFEQEVDLYCRGDAWCQLLKEVPGGGVADSFAAALRMLVRANVLPSTNIEAYLEFQRHLPTGHVQ